MNFVYKYVNKVPVISFLADDGSLLGSDIKVFGEEIISLVTENINCIAFDLRHNSYLNSFGLGELINMRKFFYDRGFECVLISESKKINKLLDMVGIGDLFTRIKSDNEL